MGSTRRESPSRPHAATFSTHVLKLTPETRRQAKSQSHERCPELGKNASIRQPDDAERSSR